MVWAPLSPRKFAALRKRRMSGVRVRLPWLLYGIGLCWVLLLGYIVWRQLV